MKFKIIDNEIVLFDFFDRKLGTIDKTVVFYQPKYKYQLGKPIKLALSLSKTNPLKLVSYNTYISHDELTNNKNIIDEFNFNNILAPAFNLDNNLGIFTVCGATDISVINFKKNINILSKNDQIQLILSTFIGKLSNHYLNFKITKLFVRMFPNLIKIKLLNKIISFDYNEIITEFKKKNYYIKNIKLPTGIEIYQQYNRRDIIESKSSLTFTTLKLTNNIRLSLRKTVVFSNFKIDPAFYSTKFIEIFKNKLEEFQLEILSFNPIILNSLSEFYKLLYNTDTTVFRIKIATKNDIKLAMLYPHILKEYINLPSNILSFGDDLKIFIINKYQVKSQPFPSNFTINCGNLKIIINAPPKSSGYLGYEQNRKDVEIIYNIVKFLSISHIKIFNNSTINYYLLALLISKTTKFEEVHKVISDFADEIKLEQLKKL